MFKVKLTTVAILVGGIILAALTFLIPMPHLNDSFRRITDESEYHSTLALITLMAAYGFGGGLLFLLGLDGFTKTFRRVYYYICTGFIIQGIGSLYFAYATMTGITKNADFAALAEIPLVVGILIAYSGLIMYARLLGNKTVLTKPAVLAACFAILMAITWFLPRGSGVDVNHEFLFDITHAMQIVEISTYLLSALLIAQIRSAAGPQYSRSLRLLLWANITAFPPTMVLFCEDYITLYSWLDSGGMSLLFVVTNILTISSAYAFNKIGRVPFKQQTYDDALLDSVIFLSSLVSNPSEIDPLLDKVRLITAAKTENMPLTAEQTKELRGVYDALEDYLLTHEQMRELDREKLRQLVQERFNWSPTA